MPSPKRYAVVGTGGRARGFIEGLVRDHADHARLVALCDASPTRMAWYNEYLRREFAAAGIPAYPPDDFERMIAEHQVDVVLVTTTDATHHEYCVRAMDAGCDVVCEKPLTTDADKARQIIDAIQRTGRDLRVTFNARYNPKQTAMKRLIRQGVIGRPLTAHHRHVLDTSHGADYFRRWHAHREHSGGLLLHKSTHHFDIVNWMLEDRPDTVVAMGDLMFYGKRNAEQRGERYAYDRYTTDTPGARTDPFAITLDDRDEWYKRLYQDAEADSGYVRDKNVFRPGIDVEDIMNVLIRYRGGALLNYSLIAFAPWEGFELAITGTKGRIELTSKSDPHIVRTDGTNEHGQKEDVTAPTRLGESRLTVYPMFAASYDVEVEKVEGGHGGSDPILRADLFDPNTPADDLGRAAGHWDGIASILCGIAANQSIAHGSRPVKCDDLIKLPPPRDAAR